MKYYSTLLCITFLFYGCVHHDFKKEGGTRIVLEAAEGELLKECLRADDSIAVATINETNKEYNQQGERSFYALYFSKLEKADPHTIAGAHFQVSGLTPASTVAECTLFFEKQLKEKMDAMMKNLVMRIDGLGIADAGIYVGEKPGQLLVELPGKNDLQRVRKLLQSNSKLGFWETYDNSEVFPLLQTLDGLLAKDVPVVPADTLEKKQEPITEKSPLRAQLDAQKTEQEKANELHAHDLEQLRREHPLFAVLTPAITTSDNKSQLMQGPMVGYANYKDTAKINGYLNGAVFKKIKHKDMKFLWTVSAVDQEGVQYQLIAIKTTGNNEAQLSGDCVEKARTVFVKSLGGGPQISMTMTPFAAVTWQKMTGDNIGKSIAIVLDDRVYSWPTVQGEIRGGVSSITGNFTLSDADDLVNVLNAGSLPMTIRIVAESVVAPSGK